MERCDICDRIALSTKESHGYNLCKRCLLPFLVGVYVGTEETLLE